MLEECKKQLVILPLLKRFPISACELYTIQENGFKEGWKAALIQTKSWLKCEVKPGDVEYFIDKELGNG